MAGLYERFRYLCRQRRTYDMESRKTTNKDNDSERRARNIYAIFAKVRAEMRKEGLYKNIMTYTAQ